MSKMTSRVQCSHVCISETILTPNTRHYKFDASLDRYTVSGATLKMGISDNELKKVGF